jgi:deoxyribose-phosphate aldolase
MIPTGLPTTYPSTMPMDLGSARDGRWSRAQADIEAVLRGGAAHHPEGDHRAGVLEAEEIVSACRAAEAGGAHFVKTSTGFHPSGGATVEAVRAMARAVGGRLGVQASGGIHSADSARAMVRAGATRLGMSQTVAVLDAMGEPE